MRSYSIEEIYRIVGKEDKICNIYLKDGSALHQEFGEFLTGVFLFNQKERENLDISSTTDGESKGILKFKYYGLKQNDPKYNKLINKGVNIEDIYYIEDFDFPHQNLFHSTETRQIKKITVPIQIQENGKDFEWMYGFKKEVVSEGVGLTPKEREFYLACKLYFEKHEVSETEKQEIFEENGKIKEGIEIKLLEIKYARHDITEDEKKRFHVLINKSRNAKVNLLDKYLKEAGSSLKKLILENKEQFISLFYKIETFHERSLNIGNKFPIFLNEESYLHIYMRHVVEFKVNDHFEHKDNFQWDEDDVFTVIQHVIEIANQEYQIFRKNNPTVRFSKYGSQSIYFEGDYYTFHIEPDGRISTFHKNKKNI